MERIFIILLFLLIPNYGYAEAIKFTNCYVLENQRNYLEKVRLDSNEEMRMPRRSFSNQIYEYYDFIINIDNNQKGIFWSKKKLTDKFYKKTVKELNEAGYALTTPYKQIRKSPNYLITKIDKENGIIISSKKWKDTFFYKDLKTRKKYEEKIKSKGIRWGHTYERRTVNLNKGTVELYVNELEGEWKYVLQCESPFNDATKQFAPDELIVMGSGSGFFISKQGYLVTNFHVIRNCKFVSSDFKGKEYQLDILKTDKVNDLAVLKGKFKNKNFLKIKKDGADLGEDIVAFGYPLGSSLSDSVKITKGVVSSLSGIDNDSSMIQIDAAIQPGNSGGPVLNMSGLVIGVASSGLDASKFFENRGYIPQNVNFAISTSTLSNFLKTSKINFKSSSLKDYETYSTKKIASIGEPNTVRLFCINTASAYSKMKSNEKFTNVLKDGGSIRRYRKIKK